MNEIQRVYEHFLNKFPYFKVESILTNKVILKNTHTLPELRGFSLDPMSLVSRLKVYFNKDGKVKVRPVYNVDFLSILAIPLLIYMKAIFFLSIHVFYISYRYYAIHRAITKALNEIS